MVITEVGGGSSQSTGQYQSSDFDPGKHVNLTTETAGEATDEVSLKIEYDQWQHFLPPFQNHVGLWTLERDDFFRIDGLANGGTKGSKKFRRDPNTKQHSYIGQPTRWSQPLLTRCGSRRPLSAARLNMLS